MVFISYSSLDKAIADEVRAVLEKNGFRVWMAPEDILAGSDYGEAIPEAIQGCQAFLFLLTKNSQESKWCPKELDLAIGYGKPVVPFHLDRSAVKSSFNFRLSNIQWIEAYPDKERAYQKLFEVLTHSMDGEFAAEAVIARENKPKKERDSSPPVAQILAVAVCAIVAIAVCLNLSPVKEIGEGLGGDSSSTANAEAQSEGAAYEEALPEEAGLSAYSWDELSRISDEIAQSQDPIETAKRYKLVDRSGKLDPDQTKTVKLENGIEAEVQILGFVHDERADGGVAGITFAFRDCVADYIMNSGETNAGGWRDSTARTKLNKTLYNALPEDLKSEIKTVKKKTNNVGKSDDPNCVTETTDMLWLLSPSEIFGNIEWYDNDQPYNKIFNEEGSQYQLFRDLNVVQDEANASLVKKYLPASSSAEGFEKGEPCFWWFRSPGMNYDTGFRRVDIYGYPLYNDPANIASGVSPCFCI